MLWLFFYIVFFRTNFVYGYLQLEVFVILYFYEGKGGYSYMKFAMIIFVTLLVLKGFAK